MCVLSGSILTMTKFWIQIIAFQSFRAVGFSESSDILPRQITTSPEIMCTKFFSKSFFYFLPTGNQHIKNKNRIDNLTRKEDFRPGETQVTRHSHTVQLGNWIAIWRAVRVFIQRRKNNRFCEEVLACATHGELETVIPTKNWQRVQRPFAEGEKKQKNKKIGKIEEITSSQEEKENPLLIRALLLRMEEIEVQIRFNANWTCFMGIIRIAICDWLLAKVAEGIWIITRDTVSQSFPSTPLFPNLTYFRFQFNWFDKIEGTQIFRTFGFITGDPITEHPSIFEKSGSYFILL